MGRLITYKMHPYPFTMLVSIKQNDKELLKELVKWGYSWHRYFKMNGMETGRSSTIKEQLVTLIRIVDYPNNPFMQGVLAHEIYHSVDEVFRIIGMSKSRASAEAYAYTIGEATQKVYECLEYGEKS